MSNLNNNTTQLEALLAKVNALPEAGSGGTDTSDATATAEEIFKDKTAYTADGKVTGTFTIENELTEQETLLSDIITLLDGKAVPGGEDVTAETGAYTTKLAILETAITALETELEGKASGGSGGGNTPATVALVGGSDGLITRLVYEDSAGNVCDYFDEFGYGDVEFPTTFTTTVGKWICLEYDNGFGELSTTGIEVINSDIAMGSGGNTIIILIKITEATATIQVSFK